MKVKPPGKKKKGCQYYESTLSFINKTNGDGNTNRDVELGEVEKWQVDLTGFEMSELNPYWKVNMRPRMDLKMNFKLSGIFKLKRNKKCNWQSKEELITHANILNFTPIYKPIWALKIKKATPVNFRSVTNRVGKRLLVTVNGDKVKFHWGLFEPRVRVTKTLTDKGCKQEPKYCGKDVNHEHVLDSFQEQITSPWLTLKDGFSKIYPGEERNFGRADSSGEIWIQYTYTLKRVK